MAHGVCSGRHNAVDFDGVGREGLKMNCEDCGKEIREEDDTEYPWWCNDCCEKNFREFMKRFDISNMPVTSGICDKMTKEDDTSLRLYRFIQRSRRKRKDENET